MANRIVQGEKNTFDWFFSLSIFLKYLVQLTLLFFVWMRTLGELAISLNLFRFQQYDLTKVT